MPRDIVAADATIRDVVGRLNKPAEYLRRVLEHMYECKREFETAFVRIGVTGNGRAPNYRIEYSKDSSGHWTYAVYNGLSHQQIDDLGDLGEFLLAPLEEIEIKRPDRSLQREHWSSRAMQWDEVAIVLGELRRRRR
jgi:hypothetical protein